MVFVLVELRSDGPFQTFAHIVFHTQQTLLFGVTNSWRFDESDNSHSTLFCSILTTPVILAEIYFSDVFPQKTFGSCN